MLTLPRITVCIPHRNGWPMLQATLAGLTRQDYPRDRWQAVLVDNGSTDDSVALAIAEFPEVVIARPGRNLGFGAGCNFGIQSRPAADVYAFLNSDAIPEPDWLSRGVAPFADDRVGCVGGKTLFQHRLWSMRFELPEGTTVLLRRMSLRGGRPHDWFTSLSQVDDGEESPEIVVKVRNERELKFAIQLGKGYSASWRFELVNPNSTSVRGALICGIDGERAEFELAAGEVHRFCCEITPDSLQDIVQNAGSFARTNGDSGDLGFCQPNRGQFDVPGEAEALCGVAMFVRKSVFEQLGGFDERYFLYFEDADFSLRARAAGWKLWYEPQAIVRHLHAGTSVARSPLFHYHVTRSHLLFCCKFAEPRAWRRVLRGHMRDALIELVCFTLKPGLKWRNSLRALGSLSREIGWRQLLGERKNWRAFRDERQNQQTASVK